MRSERGYYGGCLRIVSYWYFGLLPRDRFREKNRTIIEHPQNVLSLRCSVVRHSFATMYSFLYGGSILLTLTDIR